MSLYLDGALFTFLVVVFQFVATPIISKLIYWEAINKNISYVNGNLEFIRNNPPLNSKIHYILGVFFILCIAMGLVYNYIRLLQIIHYASVALFTFQALIIDRNYAKKITNLIPESSNRKAMFMPRVLSNYVPCWVTIISIVLFLLLIVGIIISLFTQNIELITMAKYFKREIGLIVFMYVLMIYELKFSKPISSSPEESEFYFKSEIGVLFIIIVAALLSAYFQLTCIAFERTDFVSKDLNRYIFGFSALSVFLIFVLKQAKITRRVRIKG